MALPACKAAPANGRPVDVSPPHLAEYTFDEILNRQVPVLVALSLLPGLGYLLLGTIKGVLAPALLWYGATLLLGLWGLYLYRRYRPERMTDHQRACWRRRIGVFIWLYLATWSAAFLVFVRHHEINLHYIAIFTQIGTATVVAALLYPAPRIFRPAIPLLMTPLVIYFTLLGAWYGFVLATFAVVLAVVLHYAANGSYQLLRQSRHQATHDALTGLPNREGFMEQLLRSLLTVRHHRQHTFLLLLDLDQFKTINDLLGHDIGDELLKVVADDIANTLPPGHQVARLGGDEFAILGPYSESAGASERSARRLASSLRNTLRLPSIIHGHHLHVSASVGIRLIAPGPAHDAHRLVREADIAMYEVKKQGRDGVVVFSDALSSAAEQRLEIERRLHFALHNNEIHVVFQPQLNRAGKPIGAETLVRWNSPDLGPVSPADFIPIAEQTGFIGELGEHIMASALSALRDWDEQGLFLEQIAINISPRQLVNPDFVSRVKELVDRHPGLAQAHRVVFEITEHVVAEDTQRVIDTMQRLRALGIRFAMDDFGTGYSSLSFLKRLPFDELKIDRSFVQHLERDADDQAMVSTILDIARHFRLRVAVEGIETQAQRDWFRAADEHLLFQGFLFAAGMSASEFARWCRPEPPARLAGS